MLQGRRRLVSILAVSASILLVARAAVVVTRARRADTVVVGSSRRPDVRPVTVPQPQPQPVPQPAPPPDPAPQPTPQPAPQPGVSGSVAQPPPGTQVLIDVAVATLWIEPGVARPIDGPSLTNPVDVDRWVSTMTVADKLWLVGRLSTQALRGDRATVVDNDGDWTKVVVADQPSSLDPRGYPGWLPTVQLSRQPGGPPSVPTSPAGSTTGDDLVRSAQSYSGIGYLWAGTSPSGFDCSGLTWAVYRAHGIVIPRDANDQAGAGSPVDRAALQPGDLLFYATGPERPTVHHVAMYVGSGMMIQSPATGRAVETVPVDTSEFAREFWGARRYLSS
ncbi:MAG: C40 family peptidase [Actinomycetota bacterium]|nr:C40 family peptidase [Actinomycetota bacterium]